ncbi:phage major capsid protein [Pseudomonas sp. B26(2017)]|uniref:phage major capsid protein n=1 Tax=Pseudomonas sp. B26(2017) TaxID=1981732 RepID=UPI000A1F4EAF|nr:phage major capsid protein [Pseudomonas sp. B26(2017)]
MHNAMSNNARAEGRQFQRKEHAADKIELKAVNDLLDERDKEIKAFAAKAAEEIKEHGTILADTKSVLDGLVKNGLSLQDRLQDIEQKMARRFAANDPLDSKSLGEQLTDSEDFNSLQTRGRGIARLRAKAVTDITSGSDSAGSIIQATRVPGIVAGPDRPFVVRDLIMPGRTGSNAVEYVQETGFQNMAAVQATEGATKAQSDIKFGLKNTNVVTIAHWFRASKQVLSDIPLLQSYINGRAIYGLKYKEEEQLLAGDGTDGNLLGLIPQATAFNESLRKSGDTKIDTLRRAILQVRVAEYRASAIALNPIDWADIELTKDANGSYIWVNVQEGGVQRMWKLPVVDSNAVPEGEFLVGAMDVAAQVFDREDAAVEVSTEDGDNFRTNMVTIRAEERLALAVYRPESFVHGEFDSASA